MFKFCWHCWHHIEDTRRKLKSKNKCKQSNPYITKDISVQYVMKERCCKCGKVRDTDIYKDFNVQRGLSYPDYEG
jgi:hypothetical protein